jgi:hypothetical protein
VGIFVVTSELVRVCRTGQGTKVDAAGVKVGTQPHRLLHVW